ncbi:DUF4136 domain-containing protein [Polaribacter sp.]|uniref:DUF4136 domain-containing protein n=1 Tax=Polaribacter sp. TaxID=1920175 RepID=UPI003F6D573E
MKKLKLLFLSLLVSCSTAKVVIDYDGDTNFANYKSFDFYEDNGENLNEFDVKRITDAIYNHLINSDFSQSKTPDFFIYFDTKINENVSRNTIGIGVGSGGRNGGFGISGGIPIGGEKVQEQLIIKFIDAKTNLLFWEGSYSDVVKQNRKPEERKKQLEKVVLKILNEFPPK